MLADRLVGMLNRYERNYSNAVVTWYGGNFDNFLEPQYDPSWILEGSPEIDWHASSKFSNETFVMTDGSVVEIDKSGMWNAYQPHFAGSKR